MWLYFRMTLKWPLSIKSCGGNFINMEQKWLLLNLEGRQFFFISLLLFKIIVNSISYVIYLIQIVEDIWKEIVCCSFIQSIGYWQHYLDLNNTIILIIKSLQNFSHERLKRSKNQLTQEKDISKWLKKYYKKYIINKNTKKQILYDMFIVYASLL